jgi:hypothetical protein
MPTIYNKRGTSQDLSSINPILGSGELCLEIDTNRIKFGNGINSWNELNYAIISNSGTIINYPTISGAIIVNSSGNFNNLNVNGTGVSISGHNHTGNDILIEEDDSNNTTLSKASTAAKFLAQLNINSLVEAIDATESQIKIYQIEDFNSSVSGLIPVKDILAGSGISVSSSSGAYTISANISGVILEAIQDNLGSGFLVAGTGVKLTYDDPANTLRLDNLHTEINELSLEPQGFVNRLDSVISFNDSTRTFTIAPSGSSYDVYIEGVKVTKTTSESIVIPTGTALNYLHFNTDTGLLDNKTTGFNFDTDVPIAFIHWNSDINQSTFFGEERHGIRMDSTTHKWIHNTFGMQYINGLSIGGYTLFGDGSSNSHAQIDISDGTLYQEDIVINIADGNNGVEFTQQLSPIAYIPVYYHLGTTGQWVRNVSTPYPLKYNGTRALYNLYYGGTWTTPNVPNNRYFAMWIVATNDINDPILAIMGQREDSSLGSAENNNIWSDINLTNIPTNEIRPLYRLIFVTNDTFANTPKSSLQSILDLRKSIITSTYGISQNDHGNLFGLGDDDHYQYVHINEARTISANHTFTNGLTINSGLLSATSGSFSNINVSGIFELTNTNSTVCPFVLNIPNQNDDVGAFKIVGSDPDMFLDSTAPGSGYPSSITHLQNGQLRVAAGYSPWTDSYFISRFDGVTWHDDTFNISRANGNIGIGIAYPNYTLDVVGSGNFSDNLLVNQIPVSLEKSITLHSTNSDVSATGTLSREYIYIFNTISENYALILPTAIDNKGTFTLKNNTNGTIYMQTVLGQTIDGYSDIGLNKKYMSITVVSDGSNWIIV